MTSKICPKCLEEKPYFLFYKNKYSKTNTSPYCKVCSNLRTTSYARENHDKIQPKLGGYALKRRYGITVEQYASMLKTQEYKCAICKTDKCSSGRNLAVDHDHNTGKIRGLLCFNCNKALGAFKDDPELIRKAINYLKENA